MVILESPSNTQNKKEVSGGKPPLLLKKMTTSTLPIKSSIQANGRRVKRIGAVCTLALLSSLVGVSAIIPEAHAYSHKSVSYPCGITTRCGAPFVYGGW